MIGKPQISWKCCKNAGYDVGNTVHYQRLMHTADIQKNFWLHLQHVEALGLRIKLTPLQWQSHIFNLLHHKETPNFLRLNKRMLNLGGGGPHPRHVKFPGPGIKPMPQQWPKPMQWRQILNPRELLRVAISYSLVAYRHSPLLRHNDSAYSKFSSQAKALRKNTYVSWWIRRSEYSI